MSSLRRLAEAMRASGGLAILQIHDGGRIAKPELIGEKCLRAPSAVASLRPGAKTPRAMTVDEVENLIASFEERLLSPERLALTALRFTELIIVQFTIFFRLGPRQSRS